MRPRNLALVTLFGAACSLAGWSAALAGDDAVPILKPKSTEAFLLPARPEPPANCDAQHAGWMYLDTDIAGAVYPCACVRNNSRVFDWVVVGSTAGRLCE